MVRPALRSSRGPKRTLCTRKRPTRVSQTEPQTGKVAVPELPREFRNSSAGAVDCQYRPSEIRWVLSVGWCHQSTWSLYIMLGHTPCIRRPAGAYKGDFWKSELLAKDALTEALVWRSGLDSAPEIARKCQV